MRGSRISVVALWIFLAFGLLFSKEAAPESSSSPGVLKPAGLAEAPVWPRPIPCRIDPSTSGETMILTLGSVDTPLAEGIFDPVADRVTLKTGTVLQSYFKEVLGIPFYAPLNKTQFPLPPSGWCSWYYYYQNLDAAEVRKNAQWMGEHLLPWGATVCQIDDAWQGSGHGLGENRDWTTVNERFLPGMDALAGFIRDQGLIPGLWLAPHGQSNPQVVEESGVFWVDEEGKSLSSTWEGLFLLDPTRPGGIDFMTRLFEKLHGWGYDYFKIDGQPIVVAEYRAKRDLLFQPPEDPAELYRDTLRAIRRAIGPDSFLLGCWGIPLEGMGIMNGSRTAGDVVQGWDGFFVALDAVLRWNFLHNIAWYCDPDVFYVRPPLSPDMARAWATLQGLTGQAALTSDRLPDLPADRVAILRSVLPAADIRPLDLYPCGREKTVWDLKVNHAGRSYDVVGCFNWSEEETRSTHLAWEELGLDAKMPCHVYDFWNKEYLGCWEDGFFADVPPAGVRVLTLLPARQHPRLISTSRHITQGWVDLCRYEENAHPETPTVAGRSRVPGGEPYVLTFAMPRTEPTFALKDFRADPVNGSSIRVLRQRVDRHQGWAAVTLWLEGRGELDWTAAFEPVRLFHPPVPAPSSVKASLKGFEGKLCIRWRSTYEMQAGYFVKVNGRSLGFAPLSPVECTLSDEEIDLEEMEVEIFGAGHDGSRSEKAALTRIKTAYPGEVYLSDIDPVRASQEYGTPGRDLSVEGEVLKIGSRTYRKGIGSHARSEIVYNLRGRYELFHAEVGPHVLGREVPEHKVAFVLEGDGRVLFDSGPLDYGSQPIPLSVNISGVRELTLRVLDGGDGIDYDHADWAEAKVLR